MAKRSGGWQTPKASKVTVRYADGREEVVGKTAFKPVKSPYMKSDRWRKKRVKVLDRDGHKCVQCKRGDGPLQVHHLTYERYGNERLDDLVTLCERCHSTEHEWLKRGVRMTAG